MRTWVVGGLSEAVGGNEQNCVRLNELIGWM